MSRIPYCVSSRTGLRGTASVTGALRTEARTGCSDVRIPLKFDGQLTARAIPTTPAAGCGSFTLNTACPSCSSVPRRSGGSSAQAAEGAGANALGDPRIALTWLANHLSKRGIGLKAGDIVTTGTCITPLPIAPGDRIIAAFVGLGQVTVAFD